jgi:hypothetical protein
MYEQGWGVARDLVEAQRWFAQAAETAAFARDRQQAMQARDRVTRQLAPAPTPAAPLPLSHHPRHPRWPPLPPRAHPCPPRLSTGVPS